MRPASDAQMIVRTLRERGLTVATGESLTGGLVVAALVDVPGASAVVRGGTVAYLPDVKTAVLGVDADLIAREGTVHPDVAVQLARGAARVFGADLGIGTTGVAGPGPAEGKAAGTVFVAVVDATGVLVEELHAAGDRDAVRHAAVAAALSVVRARLEP